MADPLDDFLRRVREAAPERADEFEEIAFAVRREFGGERYYIAKSESAWKKKRLGDALAAGSPLREAFALAGVGTRWGYRLMARRWRG